MQTVSTPVHLLCVTVGGPISLILRLAGSLSEVADSVKQDSSEFVTPQSHELLDGGVTAIDQWGSEAHMTPAAFAVTNRQVSGHKLVGEWAQASR